MGTYHYLSHHLKCLPADHACQRCLQLNIPCIPSASLRFRHFPVSFPTDQPWFNRRALRFIQESSDDIAHYPDDEGSNDITPLPKPCNTRLSAILLRFFASDIAVRFDLCDPQSHFSRVVPQRARSSPPLLHAILTTSARHLIRIPRYRNAAGVVEWQGHCLPDLTEESAVRYHNECIRDLLALSMDPVQIHNDDLLAAAIILRTDEEMDAPLREEPEDHEVFLRMLAVFIAAQIAQPGTVGGFREVAFWIALRQEVFTSFVKQRALNFPLAHCEAFRSLSPAEDPVWANRLIIFCADVLEYCYGSGEVAPEHSSTRWCELVEYQNLLARHLPASFEPLYNRSPDHAAGEVFPEIWHLDRWHVTGVSHAELARILLVVFDPMRPRLGPGSAAGQRAMAEEVRGIVRRLCGMAVCNRRLPPVFNTALMGIVTCGEYFEERREQEALLGVLGVMQREHAFPTSKIEERFDWSR
ncbi:hypothetical protein AWENTII_010688 [Aspergillus wentii]